MSAIIKSKQKSAASIRDSSSSSSTFSSISFKKYISLICNERSFERIEVQFGENEIYNSDEISRNEVVKEIGSSSERLQEKPCLDFEDRKEECSPDLSKNEEKDFEKYYKSIEYRASYVFSKSSYILFYLNLFLCILIKISKFSNNLSFFYCKVNFILLSILNFYLKVLNNAYCLFKPQKSCQFQEKPPKISSPLQTSIVASKNVGFSKKLHWKIDKIVGYHLVLFLFCCQFCFVSCSEFPERECCDPIYPAATSTPPPQAPSAITVPAGKTGLNVRTSIAILNCLLARQLCFEDASCSAILEIIPRVCGSELVACSTVTVTKCQAALRTLQAFPFFKPTCLCKEPNVDPECNSFRDFLFDHPCVFVLKKEKDPYPVEALPTCNYALNVCHSEKPCNQLFENFKAACRARDGDCRMDDRDQCREAWTALRMSPLFGCICPNNHMKKRCDRIFAMVNHNPCVGTHQGNDDQKKPTLPKGPSNGNEFITGGDISQEEVLEIDDHHVSPHIMEEGLRRTFGRPGRRKGGGKNHHLNSHYDNKRIGSGEGMNEAGGDGSDTRVSLHSTCHLALDRCIRDQGCTTALTPVLQTCDASRCDREGCMEALKNFYRTPSVQWNLEIAFCLCKKTYNKEDPCMNAQEKLHPVCAQREPGAPLPACHVLALTCREDPECRSRLELYEQSCAVDSVTRRCAGSAEACRNAMLAMLGTSLRTACACKGTDYTHMYDCIGWQRLLWLNPCVVESQSDFHIKTYGGGTTPSMLDNVIRTIHNPGYEPEIKPTTTAISVVTTKMTSATIIIPINTRPTLYTNIEFTAEKNGRNIEVEVQGSKTVVALPGPRIIIQEIPTTEVTTASEPMTTTPTTTTTELVTTTTSTTTSTTPEPVKFCTVKRPNRDDQFVQKGRTRRLYRDAELDCSELCHCDEMLSVSCQTVCVRHTPCRTALAFYSHAAPAYQAYRGRCYCYSGSFICMRPNPGEYSLPPGVYLLLGFSSQDEAMLRPHTRMGLEDAVRVLQEYMLTLSDEGTNCTLTLFNVTSENMIVSAGIPASQKDRTTNSVVLLDTDKIECIHLLEGIKSKINSQDYDISSHLLLSIFKIAEVDVVYPAISSAHSPSPGAILLLAAAILLLLRHHLPALALIKQTAHFLYSFSRILIGKVSMCLHDISKCFLHTLALVCDSARSPSTVGIDYCKTYDKHINLVFRLAYVMFRLVLGVRCVVDRVLMVSQPSKVNSATVARRDNLVSSKTDVYQMFYKDLVLIVHFEDILQYYTDSPIFLNEIIVVVDVGGLAHADMPAVLYSDQVGHLADSDAISWQISQLDGAMNNHSSTILNKAPVVLTYTFFEARKIKQTTLENLNIINVNQNAALGNFQKALSLNGIAGVVRNFPCFNVDAELSKLTLNFKMSDLNKMAAAPLTSCHTFVR